MSTTTKPVLLTCGGAGWDTAAGTHTPSERECVPGQGHPVQQAPSPLAYELQARYTDLQSRAQRSRTGRRKRRWVRLAIGLRGAWQWRGLSHRGLPGLPRLQLALCMIVCQGHTGAGKEKEERRQRTSHEGPFGGELQGESHDVIRTVCPGLCRRRVGAPRLRGAVRLPPRHQCRPSVRCVGAAASSGGARAPCCHAACPVQCCAPGTRRGTPAWRI